MRGVASVAIAVLWEAKQVGWWIEIESLQSTNSSTESNGIDIIELNAYRAMFANRLTLAIAVSIHEHVIQSSFTTVVAASCLLQYAPYTYGIIKWIICQTIQRFFFQRRLPLVTVSTSPKHLGVPAERRICGDHICSPALSGITS